MLRKPMLIILLGFLAATMVPVVHAQEALKTLNFGILSTEQNIRQDWQPILEELGKRIGMKVNPFFGADYAGVIDGMRTNKVQLAWMGNKLAVEAVDRASAEVFAQNVNTDGSLGYYSMISVYKDSPHKTIDDLLKNAKSLNFGLGDPGSTSGFLVPVYYIFAQNNLDPKTTFKSVRGANHETNILAVANKQVDAAVHSSDTLDRMKANQPDVVKQIRQIWQSPLISADPIVWRKDLPADLKAKIKDFFVNYAHTGPNAAQEKAHINKLQLGGFKESSNAQLKPIRQLELFKEKNRLEGDSTMKPEDKKTKLDDINRKLADLNKS